MEIPQLGLGTWKLFDEPGKEAILQALEVGYRHIDTAQMYRNEAIVGKAISDSGLPRDELWITSKLDNPFHAPQDARDAFSRSLDALQLDYLDLFLIHWPLLDEAAMIRTWEVMLEFVAAGRAKHVGVSNFHAHHLDSIIRATGEVPYANQIEVHPAVVQNELVKYCQDKGIYVEAWSPMGRGRSLDSEIIAQIAKIHDRSVAQIILRWHVQRGLVVIPKSSKRERMIENSQIFDFELTDAEMAAISALNTGERIGPDPDERAE